MFSKINKFIYYLSNIFKINNSAILLISYIYLFYKFIDATYIKKYNSQKTYEFIIGYFVIIFLVYNLLSLNNYKNNLNNKKHYSLMVGLIYIIFYSFYNLFNNLMFNKIVEGNTNQDDNEVLYEDGLIASEDARLETEEENKEAAENMDATKNDSNTGNGSIKTQDGEGDQKEEALQPIKDFNDTS
jgi:hypothetical protein